MIEGQFSSRMRTTIKSVNEEIDINASSSKYGTLAEKKELRASSLINNSRISQTDRNVRRKSVRFSVQLENFHKNTSSVIQQGILKKKKNSKDKLGVFKKNDKIENEINFHINKNSKTININNNSNTNSNTNTNSISSFSGKRNNFDKNDESDKNNKRASLSDQLSAIGDKAQDITNKIRESAGMSTLFCKQKNNFSKNQGEGRDYSNNKLLFTLPAKSLSVGTLVCKYPSPVHFYEGFCEYNFQHPHEPVEITMTMYYRDVEQPMVTSINNGPNGGTFRLKFKVPRHLNQFLHDYEPNNRMHSIIIELTTQSSTEQIKQEILPRMLGINMTNIITYNNQIINNNFSSGGTNNKNITLKSQNSARNSGGVLNSDHNDSYRTPSESILSLQNGSKQSDTILNNLFHSEKSYTNSNYSTNLRGNGSGHGRSSGSGSNHINHFRSMKNELPKFKSTTQKLQDSLDSLKSIGDHIGGQKILNNDFISNNSNKNFNSRNNSNSISIRNRSSTYSNCHNYSNTSGRLGTSFGSSRRNNVQNSPNLNLNAKKSNNISYAQNKPRPSTVGEATPSLYPGKLKDLNFRSSGMRSLASMV